MITTRSGTMTPKPSLPATGNRFDPNSASFTDLLHVPGIGTVTAHAILQTRECRTIRTPGISACPVPA